MFSCLIRKKQLWASGCTGNGFAHHMSRIQGTVGTVLSTKLATHYHSHIELSVGWCVWKVGEGFPGRVLRKTLKWEAV